MQFLHNCFWVLNITLRSPFSSVYWLEYWSDCHRHQPFHILFLTGLTDRSTVLFRLHYLIPLLKNPLNSPCLFRLKAISYPISLKKKYFFLSFEIAGNITSLLRLLPTKALLFLPLLTVDKTHSQWKNPKSTRDWMMEPKR